MQRPGRHPVRWTPWLAMCPQSYTLVRTFTATDQCGNATDPRVQTIEVVDTTAPLFVEDVAARSRPHGGVRQHSRSGGHVHRHRRLPEHGRAIHRDGDPRRVRQRIHPPSRMGGCRRLWQRNNPRPDHQSGGQHRPCGGERRLRPSGGMRRAGQPRRTRTLARVWWWGSGQRKLRGRGLDQQPCWIHGDMWRQRRHHRAVHRHRRMWSHRHHHCHLLRGGHHRS